jgi:hypothetical protein
MGALMSRPEETKWIEQGNQLLDPGIGGPYDLPPFAVSMLTHFYGPGSMQLRAYMEGAENITKRKEGVAHHLFMHARGAVANTIRELENGLVANLRTSIQGELLGDLIGLAKEALSQNTDETKNVAAVLSAAAFEDSVRRLAAEKAAVQDRPKLEAVLGALKDAGVLKGGALSHANSTLKFRNDSLHADWQQVTRAPVESCLALTESLLIEYFS